MPASGQVLVRVDLSRIRANVRRIADEVGVPIIAVVKADAYGLGAERVAAAIGDLVDGFCVFRLREAQAARLWQQTGKPSLALGLGDGTAEEFKAAGVRPAVWDVQRAAALRAARPVLAVDTGMQRFCCPPEEIDAVLKAGGCEEAFTHATTLAGVELLVERAGGRGLRLHAAGSSLLHEPAARLDAVRPGIALYRGAARISTRLVDVRKSRGPVGYKGFTSAWHGVILCGYANGLRLGPCLVNGRRSRLLEVGMQSSYVETAEGDRVGDEVVLLGDSLSEADVATAWKTSEHEALTTLCASGLREWQDL